MDQRLSAVDRSVAVARAQTTLVCQSTLFRNDVRNTWGTTWYPRAWSIRHMTCHTWRGRYLVKGQGHLLGNPRPPKMRYFFWDNVLAPQGCKEIIFVEVHGRGDSPKNVPHPNHWPNHWPTSGKRCHLVTHTQREICSYFRPRENWTDSRPDANNLASIETATFLPQCGNKTFSFLPTLSQEAVSRWMRRAWRPCQSSCYTTILKGAQGRQVQYNGQTPQMRRHRYLSISSLTWNGQTLLQGSEWHFLVISGQTWYQEPQGVWPFHAQGAKGQRSVSG